MNLYVLVEGASTEPLLYRAWLPLLIPGLTEVEAVEDAVTLNYYMVEGGGYPSILGRVGQACDDLRRATEPYHFVVALDSEDVSFEARRSEVDEEIRGNNCPVPWTVVVADYCIECWLLGNSRFIARRADGQQIPPNVQLASRLSDWLDFYNVSLLDPSLLPRHDSYRNRASTALEYLRSAYRERGMTYQKHNPAPADQTHYLRALIDRHATTQHIASIATLLAIRSLEPEDYRAPQG